MILSGVLLALACYVLASRVTPGAEPAPSSGGGGASPGASSAPAASPGLSSPGVSVPAPSPGTASSSSTGLGVSPSPAPAPGTQAGAGGSSAATTAQAAESVRQWLQQNTGLQFTRYPDDPAAGQALSTVLQEAQTWRQSHENWQRVIPQWTQFQQWLQTQGTQGQNPQNPGQNQLPAGQNQGTQAQPAQNFWQKPEFDPNWQQMIESDGMGGVRVKPGYPPDVLHKIRTYEMWQRTTLQKLLDDPISTLKEGILQLVNPMIQQAMTQGLGQYQHTVQARQILDQNARWLWQTDVYGNRELTQQGKIYQYYINQLYERGVRDPQLANQIAYNAAMGELAHVQYIAQQRAAQGQQGQQGQQQPAQQPALPASGPTTLPPLYQNGSGGSAGPVNRIQQFASNGTANTDRQTLLPTSSNLKDMLRAELRAQGVTDDAMRSGLEMETRPR